METDKDIRLKQIANHLIINASFLKDLGLFDGKIGIVLFFYQYARYTDNPLYQEFAGELLDEVFNELHDSISPDFENGLSGIAWGVLYLLKNKFVNGNPDEILEDIDNKLMEVNLLKVRDISLERGLTGILVYLSYRLTQQGETSPFDAEFISDFQKVISDKALSVEFDLCSIVNQNTFSSIEDIKRESLGIKEGYAGYGLKLIIQ